MRYIFIVLFIVFLFLNINAYEWSEIGDFNEPVWKYYIDEINNFQVVGVDNGLYLNTNGEWEYSDRGLRVYDIVGLDSTNILLTDADGSCMSAGLWKFNIETFDYSIVMWAWHGWKIIHCNDNYYYIAGNYWQSFNGIDWNFYNYWNGDFIYSVAAYENYVIVSTENNVYISEDSGITFIPAEPAITNIANLVYSCNGVLYARTPYDFEESIIYVSYDFGFTWSVLFNDTYIGRIGVDSAGRLFVGWRGYPEEYLGIAYWDEQAQELVYLNDNLPNLEINRIQPYEHNGTPSVICCTQEGVYYLTDYVSNNDNEINIESNLKLSNYPNPFNPSTIIKFSIPENSKVDLTIYNIKGQKVKVLDCHPEFIEGSVHNYSAPRPSSSLRMTQAGSTNYSVVWNGTDQNNQPVSSGIYFYKLRSGDIEVSKKMLLLK